MKFTNLERKQDEFLSLGIPGNDCLAILDGQTIFRRYAGYSDLENKVPMRGTERYMMCSLSKPVTCAAALQLWEQGRLKLDEPVFHYLPEFENMIVATSEGTRPAKNTMTLRHLFTMTAGLSYDLGSPMLLKAWDETHGSCPTREVMKYLAREPLLFEPGTRFEYSLCHDVLGAVIEEVSGQKFQDYVKEHVFDVLGMDSSTFLLKAAEIDTVVPQYAGCPTDNTVRRLDKNEDAVRHNIYRLGADYASGGAGLVCTLDDYAKFADSLCRDERVLKRATVEMMTTDQLNENLADTTFFRFMDYGYGLGVRCPRMGYKTHSDFGWTGANGGFLSISLSRKLVFIYTQHVSSSCISARRDELLDALLKDLEAESL